MNHLNHATVLLLLTGSGWFSANDPDSAAQKKAFTGVIVHELPTGIPFPGISLPCPIRIPVFRQFLN
jgi:hypothetical protein